MLSDETEEDGAGGLAARNDYRAWTKVVIMS